MVEEHRQGRMACIVAELKRNDFPNVVRFRRVLRVNGIDVTVKTIYRDLDHLRKDFGAPIEYNRSRHGFQLKDPSWTMRPEQLTGDPLFTALLCGHLGKAWLPNPLGTFAEQAIEIQLGATDEAISVETLTAAVLATAAQPEITETLFAPVAHAWRECRRLRIRYVAPDGKATERTLDIHALFFSDGAWYARAYCHLRRELRSFAIHRMTLPTLLPERFTRSRGVVESVQGGHIFDYPTIEDVRLRCSAAKRRIIEERTWFPGQTTRPRRDGTLEIHITSAPDEPLVRWILSYGGHLTVLAPAELRKTIANIARQILKAHGKDAERGTEGDAS